LGKSYEAVGCGDSKTNTVAAEIPEHLRPREYGRKENAPVLLRGLVMVSQQRGSNNPAYANIKESIKNGDLINPPDIALLQRDALDDYILFINKIWGAEHDIGDYEPDEDGYYHLVIAGHTRVEAMIEIEDEKIYELIELGYDISDVVPPTVWSKIYRDKQPEDILALQMDENLHEKPSQERTAIAMVETYLYGLEVGKWRTKKEFIEANEGKFSQNTLNKALVFCELDQVTRDFVFTGAVAYGPIVELAKTVQAHRQYIRMRYFSAVAEVDLTDEQLAEIEQEIAQWNAGEVAYIQKKHLNVTACKKRYESFRSTWQDYDPEHESQAALFSDPTREWRDARRHTRDTLRRRVTEIAKLPLSGAFQALQLHVQVMGPDSKEGQEMLDVLNSGVRQFEGKFQSVVAGAGALAISA